MTSNECYENAIRWVDEIHAQGGILESCPPCEDHVFVHFDGPPHVAGVCIDAHYRDSLPDCPVEGSAAASESERAICRVLDAFPRQVALLGSGLRVDASRDPIGWRVLLATPAEASWQEGMLIQLPDDPGIRPRAIIY